MSTVWNFIKRHRGKIVTGGVLVGGVWVAKRLYDNNRVAIDQWLQQQANAGSGGTTQTFTIETRKHYIFDSQQRTCDDSIMELIPDVAAKIQELLNVERIADRLKEENGKPVVSKDEKLELWNEMKTDCVARLILASYAYSILIVTLKAQVSILSAEIFTDSQHRENQRTLNQTTFEQISRQFWSTLGYNDDHDQSQSDNFGQTRSRTSSAAVDPVAQQLFLQCIQYFITRGIQSMHQSIHSIVAETMQPIALDETVTSARFSQLLTEVRQRINSVFPVCSGLVVPLQSEMTSSSSSSSASNQLPHHAGLQPLLDRLKHVLESDDCVELINQCVMRFEREITQRVLDHDNGLDTARPLAKLVPVLAGDGFARVSSVEFDSPIQDVLIGNRLHSFCVDTFESGVLVL